MYCYSTEGHRRVYILSFVEQVHYYLKPVYRKPRIHNGYLRLHKFGLQLQSANRMVVVLDRTDCYANKVLHGERGIRSVAPF
jgi:hypothetical protein